MNGDGETQAQPAVAPATGPASEPTTNVPGTNLTVSGADPVAAPPPVTVPRRRRRWLLTAVAVVLVLIGAAVVAGVSVYRTLPSVALPALASQTVLEYADGTEMARFGDVARTTLEYDEFPDDVTKAAVAAEDPDFWNNQFGPITRSVVRDAFDISGTTGLDRARILAQSDRLNTRYSKKQILEYYLNATAFGRNVFGIENAAQAYFGKTARVSTDATHRITLEEAMVLFAMVDQPYPDPADPAGKPGFDPGRGPVALANSQRRWTEIREALVTAGYVSAADAQAMVYPNDTILEAGPDNALTHPAGLIVNQVLAELTATGPFKGKTRTEIGEAGLRITTTINPKAQQLLEKTADNESAGSLMAAQPNTLQAAAVAIEPGTGRVLAYFGGHDGTGADYAGIYADESGKLNGLGGHPPGGAFQAITLAAALKAGISLRSKWDAAPSQLQGRPTNNPIRNTGRCPTGQDVCTLVDSTTVGLETTFYEVTLSISPIKVLELARDAGVDAMWTDDRQRVALLGTPDMGKVTPSDFDIVLGLGQYPVTVVDEANVMATFAAGGQRSTVHFVTQVRQGHNVLFPEELPSLTQPKIFSPAVSADLDYALSQNRALALPGVDSAGKTGNWEFNNSAVQVSHAWATGYTSTLAFAVWIGNRTNEAPLEDRTGATIFGSGLPADIYRAFMGQANPLLGLKPQPFPAPTFGGALNPPLAQPS